MSGSLALALGGGQRTGLSAVAAVEVLAAAPAVLIGGIALFGFEVLEAMPWGTEQQLVDHRMPGGGRIVDAMGPLEAIYRWCGAFTGPFASYRAHQLDALAGSGVAVPLIWGEDSRLVVVRAFHCVTTCGGWWLPYEISCIGIPQPGAVSQQPTLLGQTNADLSGAMAVPGQIDPNDPVLTEAGGDVAMAQAALPAAGALLPGSTTTKIAGAALQTPHGSVGTLLGNAQTAVAGLAAPSGALLASPGAPDALAQLQSAITDTGELAGLSSMAAYLGRAAVNLGVAP